MSIRGELRSETSTRKSCLPSRGTARSVVVTGGNTVLQSVHGDSRIVESINGHLSNKGTSTAKYGNITLEAKRDALMLLVKD